MGVGEAECPTCHFEIKDPRCLFLKLTKKPFPRLSLASPAGPVCCGQGLLHIWASRKGGASRGLCPCGGGEAQLGELAKDLLSTSWFQVNQAGFGDRGHRGHHKSLW